MNILAPLAGSAADKLRARFLAPLVKARGFGMTRLWYSLGLPASGLQHVGFVQACDCQALHRTLQVFADFK